MKIAVVAHFDPDSIWDKNFLSLLRLVKGEVDKVIVVTTCQRIANLPQSLEEIVLIRRPNIGYDFYSYRVGASVALSSWKCTGLFFINSSILVLNEHRFRELIRCISDNNQTSAARSLTASSQISWHLQSFFLYFDIKRLPDNWLESYFERVEPSNTKLEIIITYELGLSKAIQQDRILHDTVFKPTIREIIVCGLQYVRSLVNTQGLRLLLQSSLPNLWKAVNWSHFAADKIAQEYGIVKAEVLRSNPHGRPTESIWAACSVELKPSVSDSVERTKSAYQTSVSGLTELSRDSCHTDLIVETLYCPRYSKANAKVAVVMHLFYLDLLDELLVFLENIIEPFDLYITTPFQSDIPKIINQCDDKKKSVYVTLTKNKGRDIGPFLALYRSRIFDNYDAVLKIHSKKSTYSDLGAQWRKSLLSPLCGTSLTVFQSLNLIRTKNCGIIGPGQFFLTNEKFWGSNRSKVRSILNECKSEPMAGVSELCFFAGSMFWFNPRALSKIHSCTNSVLSFENESGMQDGTLAHAWERTFCLLAKSEGFEISTVALQGHSVLELDNSKNSVPVLK